MCVVFVNRGSWRKQLWCRKLGSDAAALKLSRHTEFSKWDTPKSQQHSSHAQQLEMPDRSPVLPVHLVLHQHQHGQGATCGQTGQHGLVTTTGVDKATLQQP
jgi:hypothetical protein